MDIPRTSHKNLSQSLIWSLLMASMLLLTACGGSLTNAPTTPSTHTATPIPSNTPTTTATPSPSPTITSTPTMTPTPLHPMAIKAMRQRTYPGSEIVIEEQLTPGSNYDRYLASYQSEGLKIYALLTVPREERPESGWPIIVFNHGYIPPAQYRTTERYVSYVDGFARNGYIVFRPDYRGHGNSEGEPASAYTTPDYTVDVLNAISSLQQYPDADPERIGMWGHSMGGTLTLRAMVVTDNIDAGVIWAGVVASIEEVWEERREWIANHLTATPGPGDAPPPEDIFAYGTFEENPTFWTAVDPMFHLDELSGPLQLHHGTADQSVPVTFSEDLQARLESANQPSEIYLYEGDNHNISNSFGTAMERSIQFFDQHVKGTSD